MMTSLRWTCVAAAALVCICGSTFAEVDPAAKKILEDSRTAMRAVKDVSFKAKRSATGVLEKFINADGELQLVRTQGKPSMYHAKATIQQPGAAPQVVDLFVDGNNATWLDASKSLRMTRPVRDVESAKEVNAVKQVLLEDWTTEDPFPRELSSKADTIKLEGVESVRGSLCDKVVVSYGDDRTTIWYIDSNDHLPRKKVDQAGSGEQALSMVLEMWDVKIDAGLKGTDIQVALPTGYVDDKPQATISQAQGEVPGQPPVLGLPVGEKAPAFSLKSVKGSDVTLASHEGHVVVLSFLGSWDDQSMKAAQDVNSMVETFKGKGVAFVAISSSEASVGDAKDKFAKANLGFDVGLDGDSVATQYMVSGVPSCCVIDKNGKIAAFFQGYPGKDKLAAAVDAAAGGK